MCWQCRCCLRRVIVPQSLRLAQCRCGLVEDCGLKWTKLKWNKQHFLNPYTLHSLRGLFNSFVDKSVIPDLCASCSRLLLIGTRQGGWSKEKNWVLNIQTTSSGYCTVLYRTLHSWIRSNIGRLHSSNTGRLLILHLKKRKPAYCCWR